MRHLPQDNGIDRGTLRGKPEGMNMVTAPLTREDLREELALFRDEIRTHYATKADLSELETRLIRWMIGLMVGSSLWPSSIAVPVQMFTG